MGSNTVFFNRAIHTWGYLNQSHKDNDDFISFKEGLINGKINIDRCLNAYLTRLRVNKDSVLTNSSLRDLR